jgi:hypothetical protein
VPYWVPIGLRLQLEGEIPFGCLKITETLSLFL